MKFLTNAKQARLLSIVFDITDACLMLPTDQFEKIAPLFPELVDGIAGMKGLDAAVERTAAALDAQRIARRILAMQDKRGSGE